MPHSSHLIMGLAKNKEIINIESETLKLKMEREE